MCPLRIILIFLSATLAGFLAWKTISSKETISEQEEHPQQRHGNAKDQISEKAFCTRLGYNKLALAFWMLVDMASGKYLWRNLVSSGDSKTMKPLQDNVSQKSC